MKSLKLSPKWLCFFLASFLPLWLARGADRLWVDAKVNGKPVHLFFDSGASHTILFKRTAESLGLKITAPSPDMPVGPGKVPLGLTEECEFELIGTMVKGRLHVYDEPVVALTEGDGVLAWHSIRNNILEVDASVGRLLLHETLPSEATNGYAFKVGSSELLGLQAIQMGETNVVFVDTGQPGLQLSHRQWQKWKLNHPDQPLTLESGFVPSFGIMAKEMAWADDIAIGPLHIKNILIAEAFVSEKKAQGLPEFDALFGLDALRRFRLFVDGARRLAYFKEREQITALPSNYNRLGAVFLPKTLTSDDLIAHVLPHTPAEEVGLRNGDILLKVEGIDATKWRTNRSSPVSSFWKRPAGTVLHLKIKRGDDTINVEVRLRDILERPASGLQQKAAVEATPH
jgi:hypothetical protein